MLPCYLAKEGIEPESTWNRKMHSSNFEVDCGGGGRGDGGEVLVAIAALVSESRASGKSGTLTRGCYHETPHCNLIGKAPQEHICDPADALCLKYRKIRSHVLGLWEKGIPLCVEVLLTAACACTFEEIIVTTSELNSEDEALLLEQWHLNICHRRNSDTAAFTLSQLTNAIRSQLHFSQLSSWLDTQKVSSKNLHYRLTVPEENVETTNFIQTAVRHNFPTTDIGNGYFINVSLLSLPRISKMPIMKCCKMENVQSVSQYDEISNNVLDDRMHTSCKLKGKHRCEDYEEYECYKNSCQPSTSDKPHLMLNVARVQAYYRCRQEIKNEINTKNCFINDLNVVEQNKGQILLNAILRSGQKNTSGECGTARNHLQRQVNAIECTSDVSQCDKRNNRDTCSIKNKFNIYIDNNNCDNTGPKDTHKKIQDISNYSFINRKVSSKSNGVKNIDNNCGGIDIPTPSEQARFRKSLDNAASMVFHSRTGLPLTSSPAPVRRGRSCFDYDSSITSVTAIKSALFSVSSCSTDEESESDGSIASPCSPDTYHRQPKCETTSIKHQRHTASLLGSFEESVLNGRLKPVSTVHGFRAELGASGSFVPRHLVVPVTVFFYTLGDNDKVSSPYLGHINLGKKGYNIPQSGTVQVTLFNPLGTVVKMFVIMYDLSDMPPNSQTFMRQRTLYIPANYQDENLEWGPKWLRYLIHLRFMSSKSGRIYLHSDIRMIIFRKSDLDTATAHDIDMSYELRSFTHMPVNPKFSPRK